MAHSSGVLPNLKKIPDLCRSLMFRTLTRCKRFSMTLLVLSAGLPWSQPASAQWTELFPASDPGGKDGHGMGYDSESRVAILFGSHTGNTTWDEPRTWAYDDIINGWRDMDLNQTPRPTVRGHISMAYDSGSDRIIMFGGILPGAGNSDETWAYDYNTNTWENMNLTMGSTAPRPGPAVFFAMAYDSESERSIIVKGGGPWPYYSETWAYDYRGNTWVNRSATMEQNAPRPEAISEMAMAHDPQSDRVILFGGTDITFSNYLNETWAYDYNSNSWQAMDPLMPTDAQRPAAPGGVVMAYDGAGGMLVTLEYANESQTWTYNYTNNLWTQRVGTPHPSIHHLAMAYMSHANQVLLYGARDPGDPDQTWVYDLGPVDCTNQAVYDTDGDTYRDVACGGDDCNDTNSNIHPGAVELCNGVDDNCVAGVDEDWPTLGAACSEGLGVCQSSGVIVCVAGSSLVCDAPATAAGTEVCDGVLDEDCNGTVDNGCACTTGANRVCYGGASGTEDVGVCTAGSQACTAGAWGACDGQVLPAASEDCSTAEDDNCDGVTNEECTVMTDPGPGDPAPADPGKNSPGCGCTAAAVGGMWLVPGTMFGLARRRRRES